MSVEVFVDTNVLYYANAPRSTPAAPLAAVFEAAPAAERHVSGLVCAIQELHVAARHLRGNSRSAPT